MLYILQIIYTAACCYSKIKSGTFYGPRCIIFQRKQAASVGLPFRPFGFLVRYIITLLDCHVAGLS